MLDITSSMWPIFKRMSAVPVYEKTINKYRGKNNYKHFLHCVY